MIEGAQGMIAPMGELRVSLEGVDSEDYRADEERGETTEKTRNKRGTGVGMGGRGERREKNTFPYSPLFSPACNGHKHGTRRTS